ncbi:MAG: hypothetical protein AAGJ17_05145 [Pseudomonadota bacterium]
MSFRRAEKVDDNQKDIVKLFRNHGWYVLIISQLKNCCDIIVSKGGRTVAIEIKDGKKIPSARKLSEGEYALVETEEDALKVIKELE